MGNPVRPRAARDRVREVPRWRPIRREAVHGARTIPVMRGPLRSGHRARVPTPRCETRSHRIALCSAAVWSPPPETPESPLRRALVMRGSGASLFWPGPVGPPAGDAVLAGIMVEAVQSSIPHPPSAWDGAVDRGLDTRRHRTRAAVVRCRSTGRSASDRARRGRPRAPRPRRPDPVKEPFRPPAVGRRLGVPLGLVSEVIDGDRRPRREGARPRASATAAAEPAWRRGPPAPTAGSCAGSPTRIASPPASSTSRSAGEHPLSAMPAASTTSTQPRGTRPPAARPEEGMKGREGGALHERVLLARQLDRGLGQRRDHGHPGGAGSARLAAGDRQVERSRSSSTSSSAAKRAGRSGTGPFPTGRTRGVSTIRSAAASTTSVDGRVRRRHRADDPS